jgi:5'-nucleotidase
MDILLTNDDGIESPGLAASINALVRIGGHRIRVVCPMRQQSGVGMRLTIFESLRAAPFNGFPAGVSGYIVDGTPADCVKLALRRLYKKADSIDGFHPELIISGINPGANTGVNVLYSGTIAAGLEALISGSPAIAVSLESPTPSTINSIEFDNWMKAKSGSDPAVSSILSDYEYSGNVTAALVEWAQRVELLKNPRLINCNIPSSPERRAKGFKFCKQGTSRFDDWYDSDGADSGGFLRFQLQGVMRVNPDDSEDDTLILRDGWITLTSLGLYLGLTEKPNEFSRLPLPSFPVQVNRQ